MEGKFLAGRVAVVTGGCSGLGLAIGEQLAAKGATVYALDLKGPNPEGPKFTGTFVECNVADENSVTNALTKVKGDISIVVNSAGIGFAARIANKRGPHDLAKFNKVIGVNLVGTFNVCRLCSARMIKQEAKPLTGVTEGIAKLGTLERGVIINLASAAAFDGEGGQCAYSASKAAVVGMTLPMARDLRRFGIRVVTIAPGLIDTPMAAGVPQEIKDGISENIVFPSRFGHAEEVGLFAVSVVASSYLNAETIRLDAGVRLSNL